MKFDHRIRLYDKNGKHIATIVECSEDHGHHDLVKADGTTVWCHLDKELVDMFCELFEQESIYQENA